MRTKKQRKARMIRLLAIADSKKQGIPIFQDNRVNWAIINLAEKIIKSRTHAHRDTRRHGLD